MSDTRLASSFRDPSGFLYRSAEGQLLRFVDASYASEFDHLHSSGLYDALTQAGQLVPHKTLDIDPKAHTTLAPEELPFISYPYEWCFDQLKDAALLTLDIQTKAIEHGMTLKDASAYNVQFRGANPIFIDTLSFDHYTEGEPWVAYRQFCQHFLAPLTLMSSTDERIHRLLGTFIDGIPLDMAASLLPFRRKLKPAIYTHLVLHSKMQTRYSDTKEAPSEKKSDKPRKGGMSKTGLLGLIDSLRSTVSGLQSTNAITEWGDYYNDTNYSDAAMQHRLHRTNVDRPLETDCAPCYRASTALRFFVTFCSSAPRRKRSEFSMN